MGVRGTFGIGKKLVLNRGIALSETEHNTLLSGGNNLAPTTCV